MKVYIVTTVTSGFDARDYTPQMEIEGVFEKLGDAMDCFNSKVEEFKPDEECEYEEDNSGDRYFLINRTDDYTFEVQIIVKEIIK